jgi:DNA-binding NarL/FixJ family response regulator
MTRVVVVADSGAVMADLTGAVASVAGAYIERHLNGRTPLARLVAQIEPDLVVIGSLQMRGAALARAAEVRTSAPAATIVVLSSSRDAGALRAALRTTGAVVLVADPDPRSLGNALRTVLAGTHETVPGPTGAPAQRVPHLAEERRRRRRSRQSQISHGGAAA